MHGENICVSYGILNNIQNYEIIHLCSTDNGSSGSPIINLKNLENEIKNENKDTNIDNINNENEKENINKNN